RFEQLLAAHKTGVLTEDEVAAQLGYLVTAENVQTLLQQLPVELHEAVKQGIALDNRRAADEECLLPEDSPLDALADFSDYYRKAADALLDPDEPSAPRRQS